jgi:hypothetical protein
MVNRERLNVAFLRTLLVLFFYIFHSVILFCLKDMNHASFKKRVQKCTAVIWANKSVRVLLWPVYITPNRNEVKQS